MAELIKADGTRTAIKPKNLRYFQFVGEAYDLIGTDMIEIITIPRFGLMLMDEEGKRKDKPINQTATAIARRVIMADDYVGGDVIVCDPSEVR